MSLIVHAPNIHQGGGRTLLLSVLETVASMEGFALLDARLELPSIPSKMKVERVAPTLLRRFLAEWRLGSLAAPEDTVLCFGNLPPLLRNRARVRVFLQNRYLFGDRDLGAFSFATRWRIRMERSWFKHRLNAKEMVVYVQTPSMAAELLRETGISARVFPFAPAHPRLNSGGGAREFDFVYVASGEPHKNHLQLMEAWKLLAAQGVFPSLCLTLDPAAHPQLVQDIERAVQDVGLQIVNLGKLHSSDVTRCYQRSRALIFPSTLESFGLPLIEASALGLPIVASELDYVRDVAVPVQTFDPGSPMSIARAVKRHLHQREDPPNVFSTEAFVQDILESAGAHTGATTKACVTP